MAYTGVYERTIYYNPVNKYSVISVKTSDRSIPEKARSAYRHRDNMIHFAAVGYELPRTDQVSMVFYTVDADVQGIYRKAIRRHRQMFFYKDGALFQSRLYPADTGNAADVSKLFRHLVQEAVAHCLREPNLWYLKTKRSDLNGHYATAPCSLHYPDYEYHGNLSILRGHANDTVLPIGAAALCVCCGDELRQHNSLKCSCKEMVLCHNCGQTVPRDQGQYLEDAFYCNACLHICTACGRPTLGTMYPAYDRRGTNDAVFYNCDNPDFTEFVCSFGFKENHGSFSDISVIAPYLKTAAVNISVGYFNEHRLHEMIDTHAMCKNVRRLAAMLRQETCHFPYRERVHLRGYMFGGQSSLFAPMANDPPQQCTHTGAVAANACGKQTASVMQTE